jgi:hypothetical protein
LENAAKVPADIYGYWGTKGLTKSLTMGWPHKCVYSQNGSLGYVSEFFEVRAQVDRDLTTVSCFPAVRVN